MEDFGQATLVDGEAQVQIDPLFAETVNLETGYQLNLTPVCQQPVLLYVVSKSETGFIVRGVTLDGESSNCGFDYRIAAKRQGYEGLRLEAVDLALLEVP